MKPAFTDELRAPTSAEDVVELVSRELGAGARAGRRTRCGGRRRPRGRGASGDARGSAAVPEAAAAWSRSPPAPPASPTPTWPPRRSRPRPSGPASTSRSRPRARPAPRRSTHDTIAAADAVIFAVDVGVRDRGRFGGKPVVSSGVKRPIDEADEMIAEALRYADDPNAPTVEGTGGTAEGGAGGEESWGATVRRVLMTGVSYMIPFVAAGGLLIALGFLLGGYEIARSRHAGDRRPTTRCSTCPTPRRSGSSTRCSARLLRLPRRAALHPRRDGVQLPGARRWPATSPTPSPTGPASPRAS